MHKIFAGKGKIMIEFLGNLKIGENPYLKNIFIKRKRIFIKKRTIRLFFKRNLCSL